MAYQNENITENQYWADVYYYMEANDCDKATAITEVEKAPKEAITDADLIKFTYNRRNVPQAKPVKYKGKKPPQELEVRLVSIDLNANDDDEDECPECGYYDCDC
jgi:hypothetical protein